MSRTNSKHKYIEAHEEFLATKILMAEREYSKKPIENIPNLKPDPYWLSLGDARKLPKLLTVRCYTLVLMAYSTCYRLAAVN